MWEGLVLLDRIPTSGRSPAGPQSSQNVWVLPAISRDGNHFRGQSSCRALFGHTGCWSIAICIQIPCRNYTGGFRSWPPTTCKFSTRRSFDHHGKGNGNFVHKKSFEKWKKVVSLVDLKVMKTRNDCEIACDCVQRSAPHSGHDDTHTYT